MQENKLDVFARDLTRVVVDSGIASQADAWAEVAWLSAQLFLYLQLHELASEDTSPKEFLENLDIAVQRLKDNPPENPMVQFRLDMMFDSEEAARAHFEQRLYFTLNLAGPLLAKHLLSPEVAEEAVSMFWGMVADTIAESWLDELRAVEEAGTDGDHATIVDASLLQTIGEARCKELFVQLAERIVLVTGSKLVATNKVHDLADKYALASVSLCRSWLSMNKEICGDFGGLDTLSNNILECALRFSRFMVYKSDDVLAALLYDDLLERREELLAAIQDSPA